VSGTVDAALGERLRQAREWAAARDWPALAAAGREAEPSRLLAAPELAYLYADAFWRVGEPAETLSRVAALEPHVRHDGGGRLLLRLVNVAGMAHFEAGEPVRARGRFEELLELASERDDDEFTARASNNLGVLANVRGERELALTCYQRALAAYQRLGHLRGMAQTRYNLAVSYREIGFPAEAESHLAAAARLAERGESPDVIGLAECELGLLRLHGGDPDLAAVHAGRARERFGRLGDPVRGAEAARVLALAHAARGRTGAALRLLDEARAAAARHANLLLRAEVQRDRAALLRPADPGAADEALRDAIAAFTALGATAEVERLRLPHPTQQ
jgi:tetratricopeptide (TPR) repeat protein